MAASSASCPVVGRVFGIDAVALHRSDRAAAGSVVGGVDAHEPVLADGRDRLLHLLLGLVRAPVRRVVLLRHLVVAAVDDAVRALLEQLGVVVRRGAVDHDDVALGAVVGELLDEALALKLADLLVVERDVVVDVGVRDQAVVADHRDLRLLRAIHDRACRRRVHRVEHEHLRALRDCGLSLLLLLGRVLVRVRVDDLAVRAELLRLAFEVRTILRLVAGRLRLRQQQRDRAASAATVTTTASATGAAVVVVTARCERHTPTSAKITPSVLSLSMCLLLTELLLPA